MNAKQVWTVWCDYGASGEGRSIMTWIGYAETAQDAQAAFAQRFDPFFAQFSVVEPGVVHNEVTELALPKATLAWMGTISGKSNIDVYACIHVNAS